MVPPKARRARQQLHPASWPSIGRALADAVAMARAHRNATAVEPKAAQNLRTIDQLSPAFLVGILLSIAALALEEFNFRRHPRTRDIVRLVFYTVLENLGYRQLNDLWRMLAFVDLARRKQGWGAQKRRGIGNLAGGGAQAPAQQPATETLTKSQ